MGKYSSVTDALITRLAYHVAQSGRMLWGYKFESAPVKDVEGQSDYPIIRLETPLVREVYSGGLGHGEMTIPITVTVERAKGLSELMSKVETVMDAIETGTSGTADTGLTGTLTRPFDMSSAAPETTTLGLTAVITISATPKPFVRGARRTS